MRIYIAGPMTGRPAYNYELFMAVKKMLEDEGHEAVTPFEANSRVWMACYGRPFDPFNDVCDYGDPILKEMLIEDLIDLKDSDAVVVLPFWKKSRGAGIEVQLALSIGMPVFDTLMRPITERPTVTWE
jgi:nucleoside 2-deoxyribosyltransferase